MEEEPKTNLQPEETTAEEKPSPPLRERQQEILTELEKLLNSDNITGTSKKYKKWTTLWQELSEAADEEQQKKYQALVEQYQKNFDWALWANFKIKEEICTELEEALQQKENKALLDTFDNLRTKWKNTGNAPAEKSKEQWEKYRELCKKLHEKTLSYFTENLQTKIALCEKIEQLTAPPSWQKAADFVKKTQKNWNALGPVLHKDSDEIWKRFQTACNQFFTLQKQHYKELKKHQKEHLAKKRTLCEQVEALVDSTDWKTTSTQIHELQQQWKSIGSSGKKHESTVWNRFKSACDTFFKKQKAYFASLDEERPLNLEKKEALCARLEEMQDLSDEEKYKTILDAQSEWKKIGPVPREQESQIWRRFRKPIDAYFAARKANYEEEKQKYTENLARKETLCEQAEALASSSDWQTTKEVLKKLQKDWNTIGKAPREKEREVWNRFKKACDSFFQRYKEHQGQRKEELQENLKHKLDLCFQAETIAGLDVYKEERAQWQLQKLSENFWFKVTEDDSWEAKASKLKEMQKAWKNIGPVPKNKSQEIWQRFQTACNAFFESRR